ncbi:MAG TPA: protein translocase subunit SecD [Polyangia bacterium]|jgi:preprotein translocase subunit SecD|nr:protein translocase subunit SecD [Polyangia bacterium]
MDRSWVYRVITYLLITLTAFVVLTPTVAAWYGKDDELPGWMKKHIQKRIMLGLDLQGGLHLVYEVQVDKAVSDRADRLATDIEDRLKSEKKIKDVSSERVGNDVIVFKFKNHDDAKKLDRDFLKDYRKNLYEDSRDAAAGEVKLRMDQDYIDEQRDSAVRQGVETIRNRVDTMAVSEPSITRKGTDIVVELPGLRPDDFERVKKQIGRTAQLEFKMVDDGSDFMRKAAGIATAKKAEFPGLEVHSDQWTEKDSGQPHGDVYFRDKDRNELVRFFASLTGDDAMPTDHEIGYEQKESKEDDDDGATASKPGEKSWRTYYLHRRADLTGESIIDPEVTWDQQTGRPEVSLQFDQQGAQLFEKATAANIGRKMAIILDEKVNSAPVIEGRIGGGRARITMGGYSDPFQLQEEAKDLVAVLKTGALPAPLKKTFETQVGPTLGKDAVEKAKFAMAIGSLVVILFMLIYYRMAGVIADIAMVLNIVYQLAILALLGATLTLPGIAGVVLTVGMAVDANIIIYERIREEIRAGKSARGAVEAGFGRAFWTVFDAHVTNLLAGIVLYSYGTGPIRGFAVTLMIGIAANLFTSIWLSRSMFDFLVNRRQAATLSI